MNPGATSNATPRVRQRLVSASMVVCPVVTPRPSSLSHGNGSPVARRSCGTGEFTTFINQIRAFNPTLTPYNGTSPAPQEMLIHMRFVNLFNQGKRLMDMHRFGIKARKWVPASEAYGKACFFPVMNIERSTHPDDFGAPLCRPL